MIRRSSVIRVTPEFTLQLAPWGSEGGEAPGLRDDARGVRRDASQRVREDGLSYGDSFHAVGNNQGPGDEAGARGDGKALYLFDPSKHLIEIRYYETASA